jgi:hypothetical protein
LYRPEKLLLMPLNTYSLLLFSDELADNLVDEVFKI